MMIGLEKKLNIIEMEKIKNVMIGAESINLINGKITKFALECNYYEDYHAISKSRSLYLQDFMLAFIFKNEQYYLVTNENRAFYKKSVILNGSHHGYDSFDEFLNQLAIILTK